MIYKFLNGDVIFQQDPKNIFDPIILSFILGTSYSDSSVGIDSLTGNDVVDMYLVTTTPEQPSPYDEGWSETPPTDIII